MAEIVLSGVDKIYSGGVKAVDNLNLEIKDGEFMVLVGPSGCGKSTALRMIAGLEEISAGTLSIGGKVVNDLPPKSRDIAMVFQNYALYPHMTVEQNLAFGLKLRKTPKAEIERRVKEAAAMLGLEPYLKRKPAALSGGQRQRVAMGRAIVRDPAVFLFDEPLSNLDAKLRVQMRTEIKALHQRLKTTTVYVTHDQIEAMTMADRIVILRDGVIEQVGRPLEVYDRPANLFVAEFIGSPAMNLFRGEVTAINGAPCVRSDGGIELPLPDSAPVQAGAQVVYGIRPEHLGFTSDGAGIPATVNVVEPTGPEIHVYVDIGGREVCAITDDRLEIEPGSAVRLMPRPDRVHLFDAESGKALAHG